MKARTPFHTRTHTQTHTHTHTPDVLPQVGHIVVLGREVAIEVLEAALGPRVDRVGLLERVAVLVDRVVGQVHVQLVLQTVRAFDLRVKRTGSPLRYEFVRPVHEKCTGEPLAPLGAL